MHPEGLAKQSEASFSLNWDFLSLSLERERERERDRERDGDGELAGIMTRPIWSSCQFSKCFQFRTSNVDWVDNEHVYVAVRKMQETQGWIPFAPTCSRCRSRWSSGEVRFVPKCSKLQQCGWFKYCCGTHVVLSGRLQTLFQSVPNWIQLAHNNTILIYMRCQSREAQVVPKCSKLHQNSLN